jgi:hypothetical protein
MHGPGRGRSAGPRSIGAHGRGLREVFVEQPHYLDLLFLPAHKKDEAVASIWQGTFALLEQLLAARGWKEDKVSLLGVWLWSGVHGLATMFREGILGRPESCVGNPSPVFLMTEDDLLTQVTQLVMEIVTRAASTIP